VAALLADIAAGAPVLQPAVREAEAAAAWLRLADARDAEAGAHAFLQVIGTLTAAWLCTKVVEHPHAPPAAAAAGQVFLDQILPRTSAHAATITQPSAAITGQLEFA